MKKNNKKGFTLAELLIVVAIIAVLVAVAIPVFTAQLEKSREAVDMANLRSAYAEGMAEAVKMALASDEKLFEQLEQGDLPVEELLYGALSIKKAIVEQDEREGGIRKLLNFGHTIGHGVESAAKGSLYHGECVAIGLLPMCSQPVRARLQPVLGRLGLPTSTDLDKEQIWQAMQHDKKSNSAGFSAVFVDEPGKAYAKNITFEQMKTILEGAWQK